MLGAAGTGRDLSSQGSVANTQAPTISAAAGDRQQKSSQNFPPEHRISGFSKGAFSRLAK